MARGEDENTYGGDETIDDTYASNQYATSTVNGGKKSNPILKKIFLSCESDALGSVHRAWAVTVLFIVLFFIVAIIEGEWWFLFVSLFLEMLVVYSDGGPFGLFRSSFFLFFSAN